nr:hypothetical protein [Methylomarinum sp. Ch1-1]MDP4523255.1 hypothetical protein [Methylomarinum sp. Ch1-1]
MKIKRGVTVQTDFGVGPVVAITKDWLIHLDEKGREICVYIPDHTISVPADIDSMDVPDNELELSC